MGHLLCVNPCLKYAPGSESRHAAEFRDLTYDGWAGPGAEAHGPALSLTSLRPCDQKSEYSSLFGEPVSGFWTLPLVALPTRASLTWAGVAVGWVDK